MDPFARRMILGTVAFAVFMLVILAGLSVFYFHTHPRCADTIVSELPSPDGRWTAAMMQRRCGDEAPFFSHVNLRAVGVSLSYGFFSGKAEDGEVFLAEEDSPGIAPPMKWISPAELEIDCAGCRAPQSRQRWGPITISIVSRSK